MRRRAPLVAMSLAAVMVMTGCTGPEPEPDPTAGSQEPAAAAEGFLRAQADGDYARALSLTTQASDDFSGCPWMASDGRVGGIATPSAGAAEIADGEASVAVTYRAVRDIETSLSLTQDESGWLVELPATYVLEASFSAPAVARLELTDAGIEPGECGIEADDGHAALPAFPGTYVARIVDPTGVVDYGLSQNVAVTGAGDDTWELGDPVAAEQEAALQGDIVAAVNAGRVRCGDALCADGDGIDPGADATLTRVWTEDGVSWLADVDTPDGTRTGTLTRDDAGDLSFAITSG